MTDTVGMPTKVHKRLSVNELKAIVEPVAKKYGVGRIYLIGSVARGDHKENSDYDFCIELGKIRSISIYSEFFLDLRDAVNHEIDMVDKDALDPEFLKTVLSEGVVLYGE